MEIGAPKYSEDDISLAAALKQTYPESGALPGFGAKNDPEIAEQVRRMSADMTKPLNDFVCPMFHSSAFAPGSTDVGDVSWQTPAAQIEAAAWPSGAPAHSWQVVSAGKSGFAHKAMLTAAKVIAGAAIDLVEDEALLRQAQAEFKKKSASGYVCPIEADAVPRAL